MRGRQKVTSVLVVLVVLLVTTTTSGRAAVSAGPAGDAGVLNGVNLQRPRLLLRRGDLRSVVSRLDRQPYLTLLTRVVATGRAADGVALADHSIGAERSKARAAKDLAFLYAIDRTMVNGKIVRFPTAAARRAVGQRVQQLLASMYTRSRLAVPAPLGGFDRDINTSEELQQYATAYDTMLGAGYDLGPDRATARANLAALTGELYKNYIDPDSAGGATRLHTNNHRAKAAAAIATAAIALAEESTRHGQVATWLAWGLEELDLVMRFTHMTGDGAYSEGPFYLRYASQNVLPFARAWDRLVDGRTTLARGVEVRPPAPHPSRVAPAGGPDSTPTRKASTGSTCS